MPSPYGQVSKRVSAALNSSGRLLCCEGIHNTIPWYQNRWGAYSQCRRLRQEIGQT